MDKLADLQESSDERQAELRNAVPDFVSKTKEYLKANPGMIREIAGDEIQKVEAWLDTLPLGLGAIGKAKLNEFLGSGNGSGSQQAPVNGAGREFMSSGGQGQDNGQGNEPEDFMTTSDVRDIIEFMADLSEQGLALPEIADAVWRDYRIEYHPLKIKRMLKVYYSKPDPDPETADERKEPGISTTSLRMYQNLLFKNTELTAKVNELTAKLPVIPIKTGGLLTRFVRWAI